MKTINYLFAAFIIMLTAVNSYSQQPDNWKWLNPKPQGNSLFGLDFPDNNTGYSAGAFGTVVKTTNGGETWSQLSTGTNTRLLIVKSTDAGNSWIEQPTVTDNGLYALYFNTDNYVYAGGLLGSIVKTIPTELIITSTGNNFTEIPKTFELSQNYPNPFNPSTNLEFGIANLGFVSLKVYDIVGKEVATLVNENLRPGIYKYSFDASGLSSGIYFYTLSTQGLTETKRMILLK